MPSFQDRGNILVLPAKGKGSSVHQYQNDLLPCFEQLLKKLSLLSGKRDVCLGRSLSAHAVQLAQNGYDHIAPLRRLFDLFLIQVSFRTAAGKILHIGSVFLQPFPDRYAVSLLPAHRPGTDDLRTAVRQAADQADLRLLVERKQVFFIFQKYDGLACRFQCQSGMLSRNFSVRIFGDALFRDIGILKQTQPHLDIQDPANRVIEHGHGYPAFLNCLLQVILVDVRPHIHVQTRVHRLDSGIRIILRDSVGDAFFDPVGVGDHESVHAVSVLQDRAQRIGIHCAGNSVQVIEGCHGACRSFLYRCFEGLQIDIVKQRCRHNGRIVVPAGLTCAIRHIVLHAGGYILLFGRLVILKAADLRAGKPCSQPRILTGAL